MVSAMLNLPSSIEVKKLEIEKMARDDASKGVPHVDDVTLSESEQEIENFIYDNIHKTGATVENSLREDHEFRRKIDFDEELDRLKHADTHIDADITKLKNRNFPQLVSAKLAVIEKTN